MKIKAVVLDAYGTLFDVYSIQAFADHLYPGMGAEIAVKWRDKQIEYTRLITQSDPHNPSGSQYFRSFWELTQLSLVYTLDRLQLNRDSGQVEELLAQYAHLKAFPENLTVLQKIKAMGITTAILSNGSMDMLTSALKSARMEDVVDHLISVDEVRLFKTSPESYGLVQQTMPVQKDEVLFVSSNAWDALGATWFGFRTLWVNRAGLPPETIGRAQLGALMTEVMQKKFRQRMHHQFTDFYVEPGANADDALFPNQFVNVRLRVETREAATIIPSAAVQFGTQGTFVYVVGDDNKVSIRPVTIVASDAERSMVNEGVQQGERVVIEGTDRLRDGSEVEVVDPTASKEPGSDGQGEPDQAAARNDA